MEIIQECRVCGFGIDEENDGAAELCDLCGDKQCSKCIDHILDPWEDEKGGHSYEEYAICVECIHDIDTTIQNAYEEYVEEHEAKKIYYLDFKKWLRQDKQRVLYLVRQDSRKSAQKNYFQ